MSRDYFVSILVPTKNRINFTENILRNFYRQDYSKDLMELIIGDEGESVMESLLPEDDRIKYYNFDEMTIGEKRNKLCDLAKGDIIVFMDDDDFYPNEKVSECVKKLSNSNCLITGSSIMFVYYVENDEILKFGPYGRYHSTCGTIAFKKEYFQNNKFSHVPKAEESSFLNKFKTPLIQMDAFKSILVIAHNRNTVDKKKFYNNKRKTNLTLDNFGLTNSDKIFYKNLLKNNPNKL